MVALVDADGLIYLAGFGVEKTKYWVLLEDGSRFDFDTHKEMKDFEPGMEVIDSGKYVECGPLSHALQIVKNKLETIRTMYGPMEVYIRAIEQRNYRDAIATVAKYKGNRDNAHKPKYLQEIRDYLVTRYAAIQVADQEVDDEIGCRMTELGHSNYVICSPDKDLDQFPGKHWNYRSDVEYDVEPEEAMRWFWIQTLCGDSSDNIKGCWKLGERKAEALVDEWLEAGVKDEWMWELVVGQYMDSTQQETCPYLGRDPEEIALENARLVYMRHNRRELWTPPGQPMEYEEHEVSLDG